MKKLKFFISVTVIGFSSLIFGAEKQVSPSAPIRPCHLNLESLLEAEHKISNKTLMTP